MLLSVYGQRVSPIWESAMRHPDIASIVVLVVLLLFASPVARAQCGASVIACTPNLSPGRPDVYDDTITDLVYRADRHEVWALEGYGGRVTSYNEDLATGRRSFNVSFAVPAFGIAEIPAGITNGGNCYVLSPGTFSNGFFFPNPQIRIMDDTGNLIAGGDFKQVIDQLSGQVPPGFCQTMAVQPSGQEIAILDDSGVGSSANLYFLDLNYQVTRGPFPLLTLRSEEHTSELQS